MGIRTFIAVGVIFVAASVRAGTTNSWIAGTSFWDHDTAWSLGVAPQITDAVDFITNNTSKTVSIDDVTVDGAPDELTISNLTVAGGVTGTNTLSLTNMNLASVPAPLSITNMLTIGTRGQLQINNSSLVVKTMAVSNNAVLVFALGTNSIPVAVATNLTLGGTLNVVDAGGFTATNGYTLFTYGGTLANNGLTVGIVPSNTVCMIDTTSVVGRVNLSLSLIVPPPSGGFQITSIVRNTADVSITWVPVGGGNYFVQAGNGGTSGYSTNILQDIAGPFGPSITNYLDTGGATNIPTRYYRIRRTQ